MDDMIGRGGVLDDPKKNGRDLACFVRCGKESHRDENGIGEGKIKVTYKRDSCPPSFEVIVHRKTAAATESFLGSRGEKKEPPIRG